ncbi:MAG: hybrid sensor histidine kinase/response regulator [Rhizobiales bacterium 68-8]|nr:MAG: hybrid sensor histidine kinase/response regulator [Rhizobiales bacterium 68-8]
MARRSGAPVQQQPIIDQGSRPGPVTRLVVFTIVLAVAAVVFSLFRDRLGEQFLLGLLGVLAMIGTGYLFATAIGFVQISPRSAGDELAKSFVDSMGQGLLVTDPKGSVVYANAAYAAMTGATSAADIKTVEALLSDLPEASGTIYRLAAGLRDGQAGDGEFRLGSSVRPGDEPGARWYRTRARAFKVPGYRQPLHAWQLSDVSAERAEQERFFLDLQKAIDHLDHAPAGFFAADAEGRVTYVNATLADWLGIDLANFTPGSVRLSDIVAGDGMALVHAVKAEPGTTRDVVIDLDLATASGKALPVRFMHRLSVTREGVAGPTRTIVLNRTQGGDATEELRAAETRFTRFFNSTPMAIAGVDADGRILRTNAPFLSLFSSVVDRDAVDQGVRLDSVIHERDRQAFATALERARQRQANIAPIDTVLPAAPNAEERYLRFYVNAVADEAGEGEEAAIVYAVETTEQKALENQMAQSQKMQAVGQLAGGIAHDFNNVLTAIIMASDLLLTNHRPSDPSFPDIMNIKQNANRAASLVRQLLAFSRRQTMRPEVLNLTDVLADLRMLLARLVGTGVQLKIEHGRDLWPIRADIGQFEQVVVNLAVNARDAMPEGGELTIRTRNVEAAESATFGYREMTPGDYVLVEVQDSGTGIDPEVIKKIFEPFFTTKEVGKGTGLGLSMVYGIVKQTGGFIFCESEPGQGATFRIFLPRHIPAEKPAAEAASGEAAAGTEKPAVARGREEQKDLSGSATVLLVEDEDAVRMGNVRALASRGYTVHEASSGVEALDKFKELDGKVDIVVSDVVMPEMDGPTLLRELLLLQPDIKFIFVSGYAEDAFAKNLPSEAKFGFLPKPFSLKQLATVVKDMLEG